MIKVNLVGNPNTGKTTLFNCLTGAHEHVGNWHGVTVEEKSKIYKYKDKEIQLVDLPGIYSLTSLSYEEEVAVKYLLEHSKELFINICDASNLQRNLYLTLGLLEMGANVILVVNQIDDKPICKIDYNKLSKLLNIPVIPINPNSGDGIDKLNETILSYKPMSKCMLPYLKSIGIDRIYQEVQLVKNYEFPAEFLAIKLLENDKRLFDELGFNLENNKIKKLQESGLEKVAKARYDYIDKIIDECCTTKVRVYGQSKLDKIFLNRFLAFPIFISFIALAFYLTFFSVGAWLSDGLVWLLDRCVGNPLISLFESAFPGSWVVNLVEVAIVGGVGSILGFLPQVALLFLFLSILEDSGYLSRVAFVFDDILSKVGLSGKSVYTLLMGFGCSTTAVLTARNMEDKNSKIKTGLLTPYMSCSAKFPIYAVLGGAFFGASNILVILGLYFLGVVVAVLLSFILEKTILKSKEQTFILEFPPYRAMSFKRVFSVLWENIKLFLTRVGTLIVAMNIIVWLLGNFTFTFRYTANSGGQSMLETLGKILAPIFAPLGFNSWGLASALIAGLIAKEVIVSSVAMFNHVDESNLTALQGSLTNPENAVFFSNPCAVISYLVFCLLYFPCLATISVLSKEIGKKWTIIGCILQLVVAYIVAMLVYNICRFGLIKSLLIIGVLCLIIWAVMFITKKIRNKKKCNYCLDCNNKCK